VSEAELQKAVIELARRLGWRTAHFRTSRTQSGGWATAVQGDGKGFPDLVLARNGYVLFVELKADKGRLSMDQLAWLSALTPERMLVWRPKDWRDGTIELELRQRRDVAA
jgi:hypothetical protein